MIETVADAFCQDADSSPGRAAKPYHWQVDRAAMEQTERGGLMCLTCGCLLPHEDHGKEAYLTIEDVEASAALDGLSLDAALKNLLDAVEVAKNEPDHKHG